MEAELKSDPPRSPFSVNCRLLRHQTLTLLATCKWIFPAVLFPRGATGSEANGAAAAQEMGIYQNK